MTRGRRAGLDIAPERAIRWITANPAKALGLPIAPARSRPARSADVVIWNRDPFSVYALADEVFIDGALRVRSRASRAQARSDFLLGQPAKG